MSQIKGDFEVVFSKNKSLADAYRVYSYQNIKTKISANVSESRPVFPPVGTLTLYSGNYVGKIRSDILEVDIRGDSFEVVANRIDIEIDSAMDIVDKLKYKLPTRINKAIIKILRENQSSTDEKHILRIINAEKTQRFLLDFETRFEANNRSLDELQKSQLIYSSVFAIINKNKKLLTPTQKKRLRNKEFTNAKNLRAALAKGVSKPNLNDLLSLVIRSPDIESERREKLIVLSNYMLNSNVLKELPSLEESLACFMTALGHSTDQTPKEYDKAYPLNEVIGSNYIEDGVDLEAFETTQPHKRYDRHLLNICENVIGGLPDSLCDFFEVLYDNDCWVSARRDYIRWKAKYDVKQDREKILSRLSPSN